LRTLSFHAANLYRILFSHLTFFMRMLQLRIWLEQIEPLIWRRFLIPANSSFGELSRVIQIVMGWSDYHLHEFYLGEEKIGMKDEDSPADVKNENRLRLGPRLKTPGTRFRYLYDFGDGWEHSLALEALLEKDGPPRCLTGERACPPEDSGGPHQYMEILAVWRRPRTRVPTEIRELIDWMDADFDPAQFNLNEVNSLLSKL
jgi:hypothetical protein